MSVAHAINTTAREAGEYQELHAWYIIWWRSLTRQVRRLLSMPSRAWRALSWELRQALKFAAAFVGWFAAWMLFYIAVIISFSYSLVLGFSVVFAFAVLFFYLVEATT
jgi:hypothetical protein